MALVAHGALSLDDVRTALVALGASSTPALTDEDRRRGREEWAATVTRVEKTIPELSAVEF